MKTDAILTADVLDIIFENRNKAYGAYSLRKFYNNRLYKALGLTFGFAAVLIAVSFLHKNEAIKIPYVETIWAHIPPAVLEAPKPEKPKEKPASPKAASPKIKSPTQIFANNIKITSNDKASTINELLDDIQIGTENIKGKPGAFVIPISKLPEGPVHNTAITKITVDKTTPNIVAEVMPVYPGGMDALRKFLERNLKNPQDLDEGQHIIVKIRFIVGYDGNLKGFETVQDGGAIFNNEVVRVLKKMPQWIPGKTKGENVSVYYTIPVNFQSSE